MDTFGMLEMEPFGEDELGPPSIEPMPKGTYTATLKEVKVNEKANGTSLSFFWTGFDDGSETDYSNRKVYQFEWVQHSSEQAQRIGRQRLTQIGKAFGLCTEVQTNDGKTGWVLPPVQSAEELKEHFQNTAVGGQAQLYLTVKPRRDNGDLENTVGSVKAIAD